MNKVQWEIEGLAEERIKREAKRRNDAFRRRLAQRKAERHAAARLKLRVATLAATASWTFVAIRLLH